MFLHMKPIMCILIVALVGFATAKPPPSTDLWAPSFIKTGFPPTASKMNSIAVPYMPKSSPFFPKFVDPKVMISKKTDMLANMFGALGPVDPANDFLHEPAVASGESSKSYNGFSSPFDPQFFYASANSAVSRRDTIENEETGTKTLKSPPPYPGLAPIAEEPDSSESKLPKEYGITSTPKEKAPPGMFGPFYPSAAATEIPIPKSTIVPADFWLPSSIVPGPMEYSNKVSVFLNKLFDSLALNKTGPVAVDGFTGQTVLSRSLNEDEPIQEENIVSRSANDTNTFAAAKDSIVETILSELGDLKADMIDTLNDIIAYRKTVSTTTSTGKSFKPVSPFATLFAPSTMDPFLPFKQRITVLSHVFDMLTEFEKNITSAVQNAISSSTDAPFLQDFSMANSKTLDSTKSDTASSFNATLMDRIKSRLASIEKTSGTDSIKPMVLNDFQKTTMARSLSKYPSPFLGTYSRSVSDNSKRDVERGSDVISNYKNHGEHDSDQYGRMLQMNMHQDYQSMPPGTIESVQAGGRFDLPGHQGGGIGMLMKNLTGQTNEPEGIENDQQKINGESNKWPEWIKYLQTETQRRKNHQNHY